ncbi:type II secretion system F family protein [Anaeromyxobacter oryzisoli]|uniref:type II secretion system F family protein n=1 Tax=Anaeromyxobacter oryzisoli TaxID=2925408 RepID=UPI001F57798E|nr:type II secretion system F family protein [Anaeromyxobacter sp. SG63]
MRLDEMALWIATLLLAGLGALVTGVAAVLRRAAPLAERLADPSAAPDLGPSVPSLVPRAPGGTLARLLGPATRLAMPMTAGEVERLRLRLAQAGRRSEHAVTSHLVSKLLLAAVAVGMFLWANAQRAHRLEPAFVIAVLAFAGGYYLPDALLASRTRARQTAIERGLPDALDLLVTCVEAGLGLDAALQRVAGEVHRAWPVLADELRTTFLEVKAGISRIEAFRRLAGRTGVLDLRSLSATLAQTELFGTSVAVALRVQAEGIRVRRMQRAEERAAYVGVKMTLPLVLCILPTLFAILIGPAVLNIARSLLPALGGAR